MRSSRDLAVRLRKSLFRNAPAKIISLAVAAVVCYLVRTTALEERFITVPLELRVSSRYTVTDGLPTSVTMTLRGEGDSIFQISPDDVTVYVDLMDHRNEGVFRVPVRFEKRGQAAALDPLEISVEPAEVTATIEQLMTRTVRVLPVIASGPPPGYLLSGYAAEPTTVQVTGPRRTVSALESVPTMPVDLSETRESTVLSIKLDYDTRLLRLAGGAQVELRVAVNPAEAQEPAEEEPETPPQE